MGIYDRDYERGYGNQPWRPEGGGVQLRWPRTTIGWVVLVTAGVYALQLMFSGPRPNTGVVTGLLELHPDWYLRPWRVYGLLTYGLVHNPFDLFHLFWNMFSFWIFGRLLEDRLGSRELLLYYAAAIFCGGLATTLGTLLGGGAVPVIGASAGSVGVVVLCSLMYPHQQVSLLLLPIRFPMWVLGMFTVLMDLNGVIGRSESNVAYAAHLGGAAMAALYHFQRLQLSRYVPEDLKLPSFKRRPKLRVYQDKEPRRPSKADDRLDQLLQKVYENGLDSLTRSEKAELEKQSRRARDRPQ